MKKIKTSVSLAPEVHERVKRLAAMDKRSMGNFLELFIEKVTAAGPMSEDTAKKSSPAATRGMSLAGAMM